MFKNTASQSVTLSAYDSATGLQKTGDSANMLFYVDKDDGGPVVIAAASGVPTQISSTLSKGDYKIALAQAETNADKLHFTGVSSTTGIVVLSKTIYTVPANFTAWVIDSSGNGNSNLVKVIGTTLTESSGGQLAAAFKKFFDVAVPVLTTAGVNQTGDGYGIVNSGTFGNAQLVRSTTPANTLTVDSSHRVAEVALVDTATTVTGGATSANQTTILNAVNAVTTNTARSAPRVPDFLARPTAGSTAYVGDLYLYSLQGQLEDADTNVVTVHARNAAGTSLDAGLTSTTMTRLSAGKYRLTYTVNSTDTAQAVYFDFTWTVNSVAMADGAATEVQDAENYAFLSAIKTQTDKLTFTGNFIQSDVQDWKGATAPANTGDAFARLGAPTGASVSADVAAVKTDTGNLVTRITSTLFSGMTSLAQWLGLLAGKQTGNSTARTELQATGAGAGTYNETVDSLQAIATVAPSWYAAPVDVSANVAAIKTKTDQLTFTVSNHVDATASVGGNVTVGGYAAGQDPATLLYDIMVATHNIAGSFGHAIGAAGSAADPLATVVPGPYGPTQAGGVLGALLNRAVTYLSSFMLIQGGFTVIRGDAYSGSRAFPLPCPVGGIVPDLTGLQITVEFFNNASQPSAADATKTVSPTTPGGSSQQVIVPLTTAETNGLAGGSYTAVYSTVLGDGSPCTFARATYIVQSQSGR